MRHNLGISRYLSSADAPLPPGRGALAFISAHIPEETDSRQAFARLVSRLKEAGYRILCDIDASTARQFGAADEQAFMDAYGIDILRLDDGYSQEQLLEMAARLPVALNASTILPHEKQELLQINPHILFVHNFYPKEDTGLDLETFQRFSQGVPPENLAAFIPGDIEKRGPLFEGLPTLEADRNLPPYAAYVRMKTMGIGEILVGDPGLSDIQRKYIEQAEDGVYPIPCVVDDPALYGQCFTIRRDSPAALRRLQESRAYGKAGDPIAPENSGLQRDVGDICQDNSLFGRYSGEITLINGSFPARDRINTIGHIFPDYTGLLNWIPAGSRIMLVDATGAGNWKSENHCLMHSCLSQ